MLFPDNNALLGAMKVAEGSIKGTLHFCDGITETIKNLRDRGNLTEPEELYIKELQAVRDSFRRRVFSMLLSDTNPWNGESDKLSGFIKMQRDIGEEAAAAVFANTGEGAELQLDIMLADLVRLGYSKGDIPIDPQSDLAKKLNDLLNAYFAEIGVVSKGGSLFYADEKGGIKGAADLEKLKRVLSDPEKGFAKYAKDRNLNIAVVQHAPVAPSKEVVRPKIEEVPAPIPVEQKPTKADTEDLGPSAPGGTTR